MKSNMKKYMMSGVAAFAVAGTLAIPAYAQKIDEIIVTSTRRAKNVQDIPVTVAVLGAEEIAKADIHGGDGIANNVPGLHYASFSSGQTMFAMRGVGSFDDGAGLDNSVALFLDGVYIGRGAGVNFDMFDLERIEVLKGPQGALFGRNTIGGAISVVTSKPADEFSGKVALTAGNEGIMRVQGLVTGPISENLSGKLVVNHRQHDGYVRNVFLGKDVNDEDQVSVRGQLKLDAGSSEWIVSGDWMKDDTQDAGRFTYVNNPAGGNTVGVATGLGSGPSNPQTTAEPIEGFNKRESKGVSLNGEFKFDGGMLTSITAFRNVETDWEMPSVGAPLGPVDLSTGRLGLGVNDDIVESIDTFSQELRWTSETGSNFEYVVGAFFFSENTDRVEQFKLQLNTAQAGQVTVGNEYTRTQNESTSYALYGQGQWDFAEQWSLLFGGRYSHDAKDYTATAVNCGMAEADRAAAGFANFPECQGVGRSLRIIAETFKKSAKVSFDDFSPMASLQYKPHENMMIFGTIATGYKSGGFAGSQGVAAAATEPVEQEGVTNYELGFKSDLADGSVRLNATAFFMDYKDLQIVRFGPVPGSTFGSFLTTNIGSADIKGLEVELDWAVSDNFTMSGSYAYLDTEAKELIINGTDYSGLTLRQAPKNSYNIVADYDMPLSGNNGALNFNAQLSHTDKAHNDFATAAQTLSEAKTLLDARIGWTTGSGKYNFALWGKNLTDKNYVAHSYFIGPGTIGVWGAPRTYGLTATANF